MNYLCDETTNRQTVFDSPWSLSIVIRSRIDSIQILRDDGDKGDNVCRVLHAMWTSSSSQAHSVFIDRLSEMLLKSSNMIRRGVLSTS